MLFRCTSSIWSCMAQWSILQVKWTWRLLQALKTVIAMHSDIFSCVMYDGYYSVLQGTRQGGAWSPFLYLVYINSLLDQKKGSHFCAPSFTDDLTLLSLSSKALQEMTISFLYRTNHYIIHENELVYNSLGSPSVQNHSKIWESIIILK